MTKHTAGPWNYIENHVYGNTPSGHGISIAHCYSVSAGANRIDIDPPFEQSKANAKLIAAAPELLLMLKCARKYVSAHTGRTGQFLSRIDEVIAKAEGAE